MTNGTTSRGVTIYVCGKPVEVCSTLSCSDPATTKCTFELRGKKAGQKCDRALCVGCNQGGLCGAHRRFVDSQSLR